MGRGMACEWGSSTQGACARRRKRNSRGEAHLGCVRRVVKALVYEMLCVGVLRKDFSLEVHVVEEVSPHIVFFVYMVIEASVCGERT